MSKKKLVLLILIVGVFLSSGYYFWRYHGLRDLSFDNNEEIVLKDLPDKGVEGSMKKYILPNEEGVVYDIVGEFVSEPRRGDDGLLMGEFVIKGDPKNRVFRVVSNRLDKKVYLGEYTGEFFGVGDSSWKVVSYDKAKEVIYPGRDVVVRVRVEYADDGGEEWYVRKRQKEYDGLMQEVVWGREVDETVENNKAIVFERIGVKVE